MGGLREPGSTFKGHPFPSLQGSLHHLLLAPSRVTPAGPGACKWEERARVGTGAPSCSEQPVRWEHPKGCPGNGRLPGQRAGLAGADWRVGPRLRPEGSGAPPPPPPDPNHAAGEDAQLELPKHIWLGQGMAVQKELRCPPASEPFPTLCSQPL